MKGGVTGNVANKPQNKNFSFRLLLLNANYLYCIMHQKRASILHFILKITNFIDTTS